MQSGGRDSGSVPGGGVHLSQYDSNAWNYVAFVVYVDCTGGTPPTPPDPPHYLPYGYFLMMLNKHNEKRLLKNVRKSI